MEFLATYKIEKKGLYQVTVNANSTIQDTNPTLNSKTIAFYAEDAEPNRRNVSTKLNAPSVTTTGGKVQLNGGDWTFTGTLQFANNTATPTKYAAFEGQTLYANVTFEDGTVKTYTSTLTDNKGKATFTVANADLVSGKYSIVIWYNGEKTDTEYYLPTVSSVKSNINLVT